MDPGEVELSDNVMIPPGYHPEMHKMVTLPFDEKSVIFIMGNFEGRTAQVFQEAFAPKILCFDPQTRMNKIARSRCPEATMYDFGLGDKNGTFPLYNVGTDSCSFLPGEVTSGGKDGEGKMVDIAEFLVAERIDHIDMLHINCQGYEWVLFPYMFDKGLFDRVDYLLVQFHIAPKESAIAEEVYARLLQDFDLQWDIGAMVWQLYRRKSILDTSKSIPPEVAAKAVANMMEAGEEPAASLVGMTAEEETPAPAERATEEEITLSKEEELVEVDNAGVTTPAVESPEQRKKRMRDEEAASAPIPEDPEPSPGLADEPAASPQGDSPPESEEPAKRKAGRPKGAKNKPKE